MHDAIIIGAGPQRPDLCLLSGEEGPEGRGSGSRRQCRRRGGDRRVPARLPQFRRELHRQPAPAQGHPRHAARAARPEGRPPQDRQFPAWRWRLSAFRPRRPDAQGDRPAREGRRRGLRPLRRRAGDGRPAAEEMAAARAAERRSHGQRHPQAAEPRQATWPDCRSPRRASSTISPCAARRKSSNATSRAISPRRCSASMASSAISPRRKLAGHGLRAAPPSVRRSRRRPRRLGPCDRRHGLDHPGDGTCVPRGRRRHRSQLAGRGDDRRRAGAQPASSPTARRGARKA